MTKIGRDDRCKDCVHCKVWSVDHNRASCDLYGEQDFHPDRPVPAECVDKATRRF
jgi:hypothetical protein